MSVTRQWTRHVCISGPYRDMTVGTSRVQQWPVTWQWTFHVCSNGSWRGNVHFTCAAMVRDVAMNTACVQRCPWQWTAGQCWRDASYRVLGVENVLLDVVPSASLLDKSSFLFLWLSATTLPSVPSKLVLTPQTVFWPIASMTHTSWILFLSLSTGLLSLPSKLVFQSNLFSTSFSAVCVFFIGIVCVFVCAHTHCPMSLCVLCACAWSSECVCVSVFHYAFYKKVCLWIYYLYHWFLWNMQCLFSFNLVVKHSELLKVLYKFPINIIIKWSSQQRL